MIQLLEAVASKVEKSEFSKETPGFVDFSAGLVSTLVESINKIRTKALKGVNAYLGYKAQLDAISKVLSRMGVSSGEVGKLSMPSFSRDDFEALSPNDRQFVIDNLPDRIMAKAVTAEQLQAMSVDAISRLAVSNPNSFEDGSISSNLFLELLKKGKQNGPAMMITRFNPSALAANSVTGETLLNDSFIFDRKNLLQFNLGSIANYSLDGAALRYIESNFGSDIFNFVFIKYPLALARSSLNAEGLRRIVTELGAATLSIVAFINPGAFGRDEIDGQLADSLTIPALERVADFNGSALAEGSVHRDRADALPVFSVSKLMTDYPHVFAAASLGGARVAEVRHMYGLPETINAVATLNPLAFDVNVITSDMIAEFTSFGTFLHLIKYNSKAIGARAITSAILIKMNLADIKTMLQSNPDAFAEKTFDGNLVSKLSVELIGRAVIAIQRRLITEEIFNQLSTDVRQNFLMNNSSSLCLNTLSEENLAALSAHSVQFVMEGDPGLFKENSISHEKTIDIDILELAAIVKYNLKALKANSIAGEEFVNAATNQTRETLLNQHPLSLREHSFSSAHISAIPSEMAVRIIENYPGVLAPESVDADRFKSLPLRIKKILLTRNPAAIVGCSSVNPMEFSAQQFSLLATPIQEILLNVRTNAPGGDDNLILPFTGLVTADMFFRFGVEMQTHIVANLPSYIFVPGTFDSAATSRLFDMVGHGIASGVGDLFGCALAKHPDAFALYSIGSRELQFLVKEGDPSIVVLFLNRPSLLGVGSISSYEILNFFIQKKYSKRWPYKIHWLLVMNLLQRSNTMNSMQMHKH